MGKFSKFIGGAFAGLAAGAIAAWLLAPDSSQAMQQQIRQRFNAIQEEARRAAEEQRAALEAELARLRGEEPHA